MASCVAAQGGRAGGRLPPESAGVRPHIQAVPSAGVHTTGTCAWRLLNGQSQQLSSWLGEDAVADHVHKGQLLAAL
jgi:hypothetical protein